MFKILEQFVGFDRGLSVVEVDYYSINCYKDIVILSWTSFHSYDVWD